MSVPTFATFRLVKHVHLNELALFMAGNDHLGYALAVVHNEVVLRQIDKQNADFTAIISIDGAWGIQHGDAFLQCQSAARPYLCLVASRQCNMQSRRNEPTPSGFSVIGSSRLARKSMPALWGVAY